MQSQGLLLHLNEKGEERDIFEDVISSEERLAYLKNKINIEEILKDSNKGLIDFYKKTKYLQYKWFYDFNGNMHMGISKDKISYNKVSDLKYQMLYVNEYIKKDTENILELGSGQSSNLMTLKYISARCHNPKIKFTGIDLYPNEKVYLKDVKIIQGDYHDLSMIQENSVDLVYCIESLCYSTEKETVLKEVKRVLKPGCILVCFDAYSLTRTIERPGIRSTLFHMMEQGWRVGKFEHIEDWENSIKESGMTLIEKDDLTKNIKPCLKWLSKKVEYYTSFPHSLLLRFLPSAVLGNTIAGYFILDCVRFGDLGYYMHAIKKPG